MLGIPGRLALFIQGPKLKSPWEVLALRVSPLYLEVIGDMVSCQTP